MNVLMRRVKLRDYSTWFHGLFVQNNIGPAGAQGFWTTQYDEVEVNNYIGSSGSNPYIAPIFMWVNKGWVNTTKCNITNSGVN